MAVADRQRQKMLQIYRWTAPHLRIGQKVQRQDGQEEVAVAEASEAEAEKDFCTFSSLKRKSADMAAAVAEVDKPEPSTPPTPSTPAEPEGPQEVIKHPLQNSWTLWFYENDRSKSWEDNQVEIYTFNTVEDFWSLVNHIKPASELRQGTDYSLFKQGVRPMWEDPGNKSGGRWLISLDRKQRGPELDNCWLEVMLCLIGEAFDEFSDDVCGAVMNIRQKGDKIGLWTADGNRTSSIMEIGQRLKNRLKIPAKVNIGYQFHRDLVVKNSSAIKNRYQV